MITATKTSDNLLVKVHATAAPADRAVHIGFLLDVSDSMAGERLTSVKRTLEAARPLLQPADRVTLVTFGETATTVIDHGLLDEAGLDAFYAAVAAIHTNGCTNLGAGLEELNRCSRSDDPFDAIVLLTDGQVNRGITGTAGLLALGAELTRRKPVAFNTLGYGADHNRTLLRELSTQTRGTYTYVDSDEILPIAMGDMLSGLRAEVVRSGVLTVEGGAWTCAEAGGSAATYAIGSIVPGRDYNFVFTGDGPVTRVLLTGADGFRQETTVVTDVPEATAEMKEQQLRCRLATALTAFGAELDRQGWVGAATRAALLTIKGEIDAAGDDFRSRPMIFRFIGQIADALTAPDAPTAYRGYADAISARVSSGAATLSTQRACSSATPSVPGGDPADDVFSSPLQRTASNQVHTVYTTPAPGLPIRRQGAQAYLGSPPRAGTPVPDDEPEGTPTPTPTPTPLARC